ncbi:hypothetical protein EVAR_100894_1 [Eumeta japonica]|uniref:Uncharacterized protein n=1 Tax=Eumeta variegata TaxID=151549 RepID=A0A4C2A1B4_EUMVA|nr:hypothetical protein EVAR_100894_1 [Eumeta japonica]
MPAYPAYDLAVSHPIVSLSPRALAMAVLFSPSIFQRAAGVFSSRGANSPPVKATTASLTRRGFALCANRVMPSPFNCRCKTRARFSRGSSSPVSPDVYRHGDGGTHIALASAVSIKRSTLARRLPVPKFRLFNLHRFGPHKISRTTLVDYLLRHMRSVHVLSVIVLTSR